MANRGKNHFVDFFPCCSKFGIFIDGIFIEISDAKNHHLLGDPFINISNTVRKEIITDTTKTGSLAQKCGFIQSGKNSVLKKIGTPRKDNETSLKEAIVLIPFVKTTNRRTSAVTTKFFNLNKNTVKRALKAVKRGIPQSESEVSKSIYNTKVFIIVDNNIAGKIERIVKNKKR